MAAGLAGRWCQIAGCGPWGPQGCRSATVDSFVALRALNSVKGSQAAVIWLLLFRGPLGSCPVTWEPGPEAGRAALHRLFGSSCPALAFGQRRGLGTRTRHISTGRARVNSDKSITYRAYVELGIIEAKDSGALQVQHVRVDAESAGQRLDNFLLRRLKGVPKTHVYRIVRSGEVRVNKGRAQADTRLAEGDEIRLPPVRQPERLGEAAQAEIQAAIPPREFTILLEDEHVLAIDKPAGVAVHGGSGVSFGVIEQLRRARPQARFLELVHRLDRETSGVLLLAKKRSALTDLQDQFRQRDTGKIYNALVWGAWPRGLRVIDQPLLKGLDANGERFVRVAPNGHVDAQRSISLVQVIRAVGSATLLDVTLKTGRTHQIRVHLSHAGHPIVGDPKYGDFNANKQLLKATGFARMFLHARELSFDHPSTGQRVTLSAPLHEACETLLASVA
jgi:23S rRNA pseudouridine955/2504/2580 synthase